MSIQFDSSIMIFTFLFIAEGNRLSFCSLYPCSYSTCFVVPVILSIRPMGRYALIFSS